jgi:hypothetical protein
MARRPSIASLVALLSAPAMAQPETSGTGSGPAWRIPSERAASDFSLRSPGLPDGAGRDPALLAGTRLSPNMTLGFGMFGPKRDRAAFAPITGHELNAPRTRGLGAGFRLRF